MKEQKKVDFIIIGAQKCGTTLLAETLSQHPQVCFCKKKEPNFFNNYLETKEELSHYHALYSPQPDQILGEASTQYSFVPKFFGTAKRIYDYNPKIKIIYLMRDPVERIKSHYCHKLLRNQVPSIKNNIELESYLFNNADFVNRTRYFTQISPYLKLYPKNQILLLVLEELSLEPQKELEKICNFLNIDFSPFNGIETLKPVNKTTEIKVYRGILRPIFDHPLFNKLPYFIKQKVKSFFYKKITEKPKFPIFIKKHLYQMLATEIEQIEKELGRELNLWQKYATDYRG